MQTRATTRCCDSWDFSGGEADFRKAFALDPSDATAHQWFAENLGAIGGRAQESIEEAALAYQLDPLSPIVSIAQAEAYVNDRQFDKAIEIYKKVIADNPAFGQAHNGLSNAYWGLHKYTQTIQESGIAAQLMGDVNGAEVTAGMDAGFRSGGWPAALHRAVEISIAQRKAKAGLYVSPYGIAELCAELGDKEHAFEWLTTAYQEHDNNLINLRTDYAVDSLRSDPRYDELVRKIGFASGR
jgi:tetratricopeptide (TPR) repeat protein